LAQDLGIPPFIVNRAKKAVQYATGVSKALRRLSKEEGLTQRGYTERLFREVYPTVGIRDD